MSLQLLCKGLDTSIAVAGLAAYDSASEEREKSPGLPGVAVEEVSAGNETVESSEYETWVENKHLLGGGLVAAVVADAAAAFHRLLPSSTLCGGLNSQIEQPLVQACPLLQSTA
jgi:hypothetical protein